MKTNKTNIKISADILAELEALPKKGNTKKKWTPEMEEVLRQYYPKTSAQNLRSVLEKMCDYTISLDTIYRKTKELGIK
jgi:hypothetical protein